MKRLVQIVPYIEGRGITIYTIQFFKDENTPDISQTKKFFNIFRSKFPEDTKRFLLTLHEISKRGAEWYYFRDERNKECDSLFALLEEDSEGDQYRGQLRLYCLKYGIDKVIFGAGYSKNVRTYQDDLILDACAHELKMIDKYCRENENNKIENLLSGKVFEIDF